MGAEVNKKTSQVFLKLIPFSLVAAPSYDRRKMGCVVFAREGSLKH